MANHSNAARMNTVIDDIQLSPLAERLAQDFLQTADMHPADRDIHIISQLASDSPEKLRAAKYDASEYQCLATAVYYEARSEVKAGQRAVAEAVLNRVKSKHYPNTICGVVFQGSERRSGCQFSFTCDGSLKITPKGWPWERSQAIARLAITGGFKPMTHRSTHFHTTAIKPYWAKHMRKTGQFGTHVFYKFKPYRKSSASLAVAPPS